MKWDPYSLKKPCANCPFLKDKSKAIKLDPSRVPGIINDLLTGEATGFSCHKTVYHPKLGGKWVEDDSDDGEHYEQSGNEKQCAGSLIVMQKLGRQTQLMQVMERVGQYKPDEFLSYHGLIIEPEDLKMPVTPNDIERALDREEIVQRLEAAGFQCYDRETKTELAEALAEHLNTEGEEL